MLTHQIGPVIPHMAAYTLLYTRREEKIKTDPDSGFWINGRAGRSSPNWQSASPYARPYPPCFWQAWPVSGFGRYPPDAGQERLLFSPYLLNCLIKTPARSHCRQLIRWPVWCRNYNRLRCRLLCATSHQLYHTSSFAASFACCGRARTARVRRTTSLCGAACSSLIRISVRIFICTGIERLSFMAGQKRCFHLFISIGPIGRDRISNPGRKQGDEFCLAHAAICCRQFQARLAPAIERNMVQDGFNKLVVDGLIRVHGLLCSPDLRLSSAHLYICLLTQLAKGGSYPSLLFVSSHAIICALLGCCLFRASLID